MPEPRRRAGAAVGFPEVGVVRGGSDYERPAVSELVSNKKGGG